MQLTKLTHACVRLAKDGAVLVIDPGAFGDASALDGADAVLVTHEHFDHVEPDTLRAALTGNELHAAEARERAAQAISHAENISIESARTQVQNYEQQYRQALDNVRQQATQAADDAAKAVSRAALLGAIGLLLGGLAGWLGGRMAAGEGSLRERVATASGRARR